MIIKFKKFSSIFILFLSFSAYSQYVEEIKVDEEIDESIPFSIVEEKPIYPGCIGTKEEKSKCFETKLREFIESNYNQQITTGLDLEGKQKLFVQFLIDKNGNVNNIKAKAPHKKLETEAVRVVGLLPKMTPGMQRGRPIEVKYNLPIIIGVENKNEVPKAFNEIIEYEVKEEVDEIPFTILEEKPIYPGCVGTKEEQSKCLETKLREFIGSNYNQQITTGLGLEGIQKIYVQFTIDKNGSVNNIMAKAPHKSLEAEAVRVVGLLPKMTPGMQKGKPVGVKYMLPIIIEVENNKEDPKAINEIKENSDKEESKNIPFSIIEDKPDYPGCEGTDKEKSDCFNKKVIDFVSKNFNMEKVHKLGLTSGKHTIFATFNIDENGDIVDIKVKAPHPDLVEETVRVLKKLPKMDPGKQRGIPKSVKFTLPINFYIEGEKKKNK